MAYNNYPAQGNIDELEVRLLGFSRDGNVDEVNRLIANGVDVNRAPAYRLTPLFEAVRNGHTDIVRLLLEHGADVDKARPNDGRTPLIEAIVKGHTDVVKVLLEHGADTEKATREIGATPLIQASEFGDVDVVRLLLEHGADVDRAKTIDNHTPLYTALLNGHTDVVKVLLEHGASVEMPTEPGTLVDNLIGRWASVLAWGLLGPFADEDLLEMVQLLLVYGATRPDPDALAEQLQGFPLTRAWLEMVKSYSQMEIAASLGRIKEVGKMLRSGRPVIELFPRNVSGA